MVLGFSFFGFGGFCLFVCLVFCCFLFAIYTPFGRCFHNLAALSVKLETVLLPD